MTLLIFRLTIGISQASGGPPSCTEGDGSKLWEDQLVMRNGAGRWCQDQRQQWIYWNTIIMIWLVVSSFNPSETCESQWEGLSHTLWKINNVWNQSVISISQSAMSLILMMSKLWNYDHNYNVRPPSYKLDYKPQ